MNTLRLILAALVLAIIGSTAPGSPTSSPAVGLHDFDFQFGEWRVHHRIKRPVDSGTWQEFEGTCTVGPLMDGAGNVEDHMFQRPAGVTRAMGLRAYDPRTAKWSIWWVDGRDPSGALDPPMRGAFENGVGTFYWDGMVEGKPIRTRFIWSQITAHSARWEQAYSGDAGKTWETNWIMEFRRIR